MSVEDEGGAGDIADSAWAGGGMLQGAPALFEFGGGAFAQDAHRHRLAKRPSTRERQASRGFIGVR
ncbi:hypothetical protein [Streptomyces sp. NPDC002540]